MNQKQITLCGKTYPVAFTLDTMIRFEHLLKRSFFLCNFELLDEQIAVTLCAVFTANPDADISADEVMQADTLAKLKELTDAYAVVKEMIIEFFKDDAAEPEPKAEDDSQEGEKPKN